MIIIEIQQQPQYWIAALYKNQQAGEAYLNKFPESIRSLVRIQNVELDFPLYVIERMVENQNQFSFTNHEGLIDEIRALKKHVLEDTEQVYFTFYTIETDYFQEDVIKSQMGALEHTHVDNAFLNEEQISYSANYEVIQELVVNYDMDGLDAMCQQFIQDGASDYEKEELATYGYMNLYWQLIYDFVCNKLSEGAVDVLIYLVEQSEKLSGEIYWAARAEARMTVLEEASKNKDAAILEKHAQAIQALEDFAKEEPKHLKDAYEKIARAHHIVAQTIPDGSEVYVKDAITFVQKSIALNPELGDWNFLLQILYVPIQDVSDKNVLVEIQKTEDTKPVTKYSGKQLSVYQIQIQKEIPALMQQYEQFSLKMPYVYALAIYNVRNHLLWFHLDGIVVSEEIYFHWLNKAVLWNPETITRIDLGEACQFFEEEGVRLNRVDLIMKVIAFYERVLLKLETPALELYYIAQAWQLIADIYLSSGAQADADAAMTAAIAVYNTNLETIKRNYSTHAHYLKFLEYCYLYEGAIEKPSLETLLEVCEAVEEESQGYYSAPILLHMRLALIANKEDDAIYQLTKSLVLHELCIDNEIANLLEMYRNATFPKLFAFLEDTNVFMKAARANYYLDTELKWDDVRDMSAADLAIYWVQRKEVILKREPMNWGEA